MDTIVLEGTVGGPRRWVLADIEVEADGTRTKRSASLSHFPVSSDGETITVDAAAAVLRRYRRERARGTWASLERTELGKLADFAAGPHVRVQLECTGLRAGDRVRIEGVVLERDAESDGGYRASSRGRPTRVRADRIDSLEPDAVSGETAAPVRRSRDRLRERSAQAGLAALAVLHLAAVGLIPSDGDPYLMFVRSGWVALAVTLLVHVLIDARAVPLLMRDVPHRSILPTFLTVGRSPATVVANDTSDTFAVVRWLFAAAAVLPSAVYAAMALRAPVTTTEPLAVPAVLYGALTLGIAFWTTARAATIRRTVNAILRASPWRGREGWHAADGTIGPCEPMTMRVRTRFVRGSARSIPNRIEQTLTTSGPAEITARTPHGDIAIAVDGARIACDRWTLAEGTGRHDREHVSVLAAGMSVLVVGDFARGSAVRARGPETLLVFASATDARRSLGWRRRALWLVWAGPLAGLGFLLAQHLT